MSVVVTAVPGPEIRAQLVGLGFTLPSGGTLHDAAAIPTVLKAQIQQAAAGPSTGNGSGAGVSDPAAHLPAEEPKTSWLLYGGIGLGVVFLGILLVRR